MVLGLNEDQSVPLIQDFADEKGSTFPLVINDRTYDLYENPGPGNYALEIVIDRDGIVRFAQHGSTTDEIEAAITELLGQ